MRDALRLSVFVGMCFLFGYEILAQRVLPNGQRIDKLRKSNAGTSVANAQSGVTPKPDATASKSQPLAPSPVQQNPTGMPTGTNSTSIVTTPSGTPSFIIQNTQSLAPAVAPAPTPVPAPPPAPQLSSYCKDVKLPSTHHLLARSEQAANVIRELFESRDGGLMLSALDNAICVGVVPSMKKGGLGIGGQWGRGVISCRYDNKDWSPPAFFSIKGGSYGLQAGLEVVDLVMMVSTRSGVNALLHNKLQLGANAGASALIFGRSAGVGTDVLLDSRVLTYSRSRGLYAGVELQGGWVSIDQPAICSLYGMVRKGRDEDAHAHQILSMPRPGGEAETSLLYSYSKALRDLSTSRPYRLRYIRPRPFEKIVPLDK